MKFLCRGDGAVASLRLPSQLGLLLCNWRGSFLLKGNFSGAEGFLAGADICLPILLFLVLQICFSATFAKGSGFVSLSFQSVPLQLSTRLSQYFVCSLPAFLANRFTATSFILQLGHETFSLTAGYSPRFPPSAWTLLLKSRHGRFHANRVYQESL